MRGDRFQESTFSAPVCTMKMSDLEYALRVGNITQQEYDTLKESERSA